jgi:hypothetical protein
MKFEKKSFWNLLSDIETANITIPIIQRSYTQGGRSGDPKIEIKGKRFLDRLVEALKGKAITLDFIYGSNIKNKVFPLDGQQRLTTLFLLHWYIAQKENKLTDDVKKTLKKFSYETRQSSRYFCEHLCDYQVIQRKDRLSDTVMNQKWFMLSWKDDPSIASMLGMLDKIDEALKNNENSYWNILTENVDNCPVSFFYTSLQDLKLTDDLYIKMNARGLELSDFDKFKAAFNKAIDEAGWDNGKDMTEKFGHKIDTAWTDLFWQYREDKDRIDNELINFIAGTAINCYAQNSEIVSNEDEEQKIRAELEKKGKSRTDEAVKKERIERRIAHLANNSSDVCPDDFTGKNSFDYLVNSLNKYAENNNDKTVTERVSLWDYCDETLFKDLILDNITYSKRVLFYAQTEYLLNNTFEQSAFDDWMRVIRNIVENNAVDSATTFISAIHLVREMSAGSNNIYDYLSKEPTVSSGHAKEQVNQEIEKAKLIVANPIGNKPLIFDTEDLNFCKGDIDFVLFCIDYTPDMANFDAQKLRKLKDLIKKELDVEQKITDEFKRAFLTVRGNNYYNVRYTWSCSFNCDKNWLFEKYSDLKKYFTKRNTWREYLKDLLIQRMESGFSTICEKYEIPDGMPKWKEKLIKNPKKINGATFILIPRGDNSHCYLARQQRPSRLDQVTKIK